MKRSPAKGQRPAANHSATSIQLSGPSEKLRVAARDGQRMVEQIARKRDQLAQLRNEASAIMTAVAGRMAPLEEERQRLDGEIHGLFEELLAGKRAKKTLSRIRGIYRQLQDDAIISFRLEIDDDLRSAFNFDSVFEGMGEDDPFPGAPPPEQEAPSAVKHHDRGALRDIYRRLVELLHPDQVQDAADRAHRTEVMKDVTVAYRERDIGRLIEIERRWAAAPEAPSSDDEAERRLAIVLEQNHELKKQLRAADKELRAFRRSHEGQVVRAATESGDGLDGAVAGTVEAAEQDMKAIREVHQFVTAFHAGKITLATFLDGPALESSPGATEPSAEDIEGFFTDFLNVSFDDMVGLLEREFGKGVGAGSRRAAKGAKKSGRKKRR